MRASVICGWLACMMWLSSCSPRQKIPTGAETEPDSLFSSFQLRFLDSFWKENPGDAIGVGYGKYYDRLPIPDSAWFEQDVAWDEQWLDSLKTFDYARLSNDHQISYRVIENRLESGIWYTDTFKLQQWDPSGYNIGAGCYYILTQPYAPLAARLRDLSAHLRDAPGYYAAALQTIRRPSREYTELAIQQNEGSLDVFGDGLRDSIRAAALPAAEQDSLQRRITTAVSAIKAYTASLRKMLTDKNSDFRDFRIGKDLFRTKFRYDLVTDYSPEEMFAKADSAKKYYHGEMFRMADSLWIKYGGGQPKPKDSLDLVRIVLDKIALQHAAPGEVVQVATGMVHRLEHFIITRDLFDYDSSYPLVVRVMPAFMAGVALANAEFTPPYLSSGTTYYNVSDLSKLPAAAAESELREYNNYSLQLLSIHEAMPGHCLQGVYNQKKSNNRITSVFQNGAMIEGWAVYCEQMMVENGWGDYAPELKLVLYKWRLRELGNVLVDYGLQCLHWSKEDVQHLLVHETFQEEAQVAEKYHRASISQVQLCSYFTGLTEILSLRDTYKNKMGDRYRLKDFHEQFLSHGSAPVRYIREMMLK